ncbi:hypothetical protein [Mesorhizobium caraganae]|nr:hypothetical protein [Mesorhizobium caraganae]
MLTMGGFAALAVGGAACADREGIRVMPTEWSTLSCGRVPRRRA